MSKFLRRLTLLFLVTFLGVTSFGLSYFYFENSKEENSSFKGDDSYNNLKVDDIEENYNFGKNTSSNEGKTYTIYFFPSASYIYLYRLYLDYLDTQNGVENISSMSQYKPEEQFGYKEPVYNSDGSLKVDSNNEVIYKLSENTGYYKTTDMNGNSLSYGDLTYDGGYRKFMADQYSVNYFEADGGYAYDSNGAYMLTQSYDQNNGKARRSWGLPKENENFTIKSDDSEREEHFNGRNQYSSDRLGSWGEHYYYGKTIRDSDGDVFTREGLIYGECTKDYTNIDDIMLRTDDGYDLNNDLTSPNAGRYLPIKLTVTNELMSSILEKVVPDVFTSMGTELSGYTYKYLHNYTFTEWTYVKNTEDRNSRVYPYEPWSNAECPNTSYSDKKVGQAFQSKPTEYYFDPLADLDEYADSEGVIRLFPLFSNSKKTNVSESDTDPYLLGGGSSEKLKITYSSNVTTTSNDLTSSNDNIQYKYPLFTTSTYSYNNSDTFIDNEGNSYSSLNSKNIRLFSYNNVKINSKVSSLEFSCNNINDEGKIKSWVVDSDTSQLKWTNLYSIDSDYINDNIIKIYGEGSYNFYVIVGNYSYQDYNPSDTSKVSLENAKTYFKTFYNDLTSQARINAFDILENKRLSQIEYNSTYSNIDEYITSIGNAFYSPTIVLFERTDEPKLMITNNEECTNDITTFIKNNYNSGRSLWRNVNPLYEGELDSSTNTYNAIGDDLSKSSPYTFISKNVDLSSSSNNYFVISLNDEISISSHFNINNDVNKPLYLISNPGDKSNIKPENIYYSALSNYVDVVKNETTNEIVFKLKENEEGIYDIIIKLNMNNEGDDKKFDLYMRKHDELFIEVFDNDLNIDSTSKYVDHEYDENYKTSSGAYLLFENKYVENSNLLSNNTSISVNNNKTLDECLRYKISSNTDYNYSNGDLLNYRLVDRNTGECIGKYIKNEDNTYSLEINEFKVKKNYILILKKIN